MERDHKESEPQNEAETRKFAINGFNDHRPTAAFLAALRAVVAMARNET